MTRKNYDMTSYNPNHRPLYMNRPPRPYHKGNQNHRGNQKPMDEVSLHRLQGAIASLSNHVESVTKNQKYLIDAQEKTAAVLERQVIAIERILDHLNNF